MTVWIPQPLFSYTKRQQKVEAEGSTLAELIEDLDRQYRGIRFRIVDEQDRLRPHVKCFVNREQAKCLDLPLAATDEVHICQALSGG